MEKRTVYFSANELTALMADAAADMRGLQAHIRYIATMEMVSIGLLSKDGEVTEKLQNLIKSNDKRR